MNNPQSTQNLVFYRKYRPQKFDEIIGQENTVKILKNAIKENRLAHAYLFAGPRGTGKTTIARILAREAGCAEEDIVEIDAASSRGIDEARALREAAHVLPMRSAHKIYIIDEVHMLTKEAFNALLKILEEPPKHTIFILATTELSKVPETVVSRTQRFEFSKISIPDILKELNIIAKAENIKAEDDALKLVAFFADGSLRDAENIFFQITSAGEKIVKEEDVRLLLGAPKEEDVNNILKFVFEKNAAELIKTLDDVLEEGRDPSLILRLLLRSFRAIYFLAVDAKIESVLAHEFSDDEIVLLRTFAQKGAKAAEFAFREVLDASRVKTDDYTASYPLELALIRIATNQ
ncbi:DNA polymerase III, subunit gamma and tau [Candidatus Giovannonibacteria bacterium RIFCSPHIGHO2_02_43_13]|uniref:DNA polymerase III subunit gamma/tau n=1 Tax=Candidatus Giovannonibacteria bacterium RIFCSPHIGHO2_02_43_13 TaxID=1798330 RepID=A0A1F5WPW8_9BACT|nr:MAG: polymerase III, subunit gamma and tau protein [Parcubacteria group bacterium GW2011_GWA2_44_13]OGF73151.1 MAG: DNA polymerase III, subunit gamma and tau [Candidatus Giovannonibacteria bacterium RIFCSPHIGHO2_12_FULL_44_42]OGF77670.1 MAG: DNA polymerase III, subunit gamma and tau [Candidatus Giovannonibacteria bacterium RIFCSPHIGHO2_02_43_13]OGF88984.1 MAG: DNA polymerase III, subunit gamma and tau [Candidatus Giovannonibacteria bacterium RIFCSPLOWO2_02_FULL_43_54]OGF97420.1 MAG: DNA poly